MMGESKEFTLALGFHALMPLHDDRVVAVSNRERTFRRAPLDQAATQPALRVPDVGCGVLTFAVAPQRRRPCAQVSGLHADPPLLAIAARKARDAGADMEVDLRRSSRQSHAEQRFDRMLSGLFFHCLSWDELLSAREGFRQVEEMCRIPTGFDGVSPDRAVKERHEPAHRPAGGKA